MSEIKYMSAAEAARLIETETYIYSGIDFDTGSSG